MEPAHLLHNMCHEALTNVDINAIRKNRGFSEAETASRSLLENFYLAEIGVREAMNKLTQDEISALYMLKMAGEPVKVSAFENLYRDRDAPTPRYDYRTFSQRFQETFKKVRTLLVRRGILIMAEAGTAYDETKMERWRFLLPKEFEPHLPPLFPNAAEFPETVTFEQAGTVNRDVLRNVLFGSETEQTIENSLRISKGSLLLGKQAFRARSVHEWLQEQWRSGLKLPKSTNFSHGKVHIQSTSPVDAIHYLLGQLGPNQWVTPNQIAPALYIFCGPKRSDKGVTQPDVRQPSAGEICRAGWQWGQLACYKDGTKEYYRLAPNSAITLTLEEEPTTYLKILDDGSIQVDLGKITHDHLELISQISDLNLEGGQLVAKPNRIKLGKIPLDVRNRLLVQWMGEHSPAYKTALSTVEKQWGKQIVHTNLMVAKINDLSLKAAIEKAFAKSNEIEFLPNDYIAFPPSLLPKVERAVKKAGHVVKTVFAEV
ncbi:MAG: hypothetical protein AAF702_01805 [Chloroflexota bacterium]